MLLICGCSEPHSSQTIAGVWAIEWNYESETRLGVLVLNEDHTGHFSVEADTQSLLLPLQSKTHVNIRWQQVDSLLTMTRLDNNFELNYHIKAASNNIIELLFADDIDVRLIRK